MFATVECAYDDLTVGSTSASHWSPWYPSPQSSDGA